MNGGFSEIMEFLGRSVVVSFGGQFRILFSVAD